MIVLPEAVAVIGAGTMGQGIAQVCAQAGHPTLLVDPYAEALTRAQGALKEVFAMLERKGRLESAQDTLSRLRFSATLDDVQDANWIIEAVPEKLELKRELFATLASLAPDAMLATNTSTLSVTAIAAASKRESQILGLHFFNPAPLMKLVEVIPGVATSPEVVDKALAFVQGLGKEPVVAKDAPGFIVNRLARPFYGEALKLHGEGVPTETIDRAMRALNFPLGPFELMDLIGLDVNYAASSSVYEAFFCEPRYRPHPIQRALVEAGRLGKKSGRGFYRYPRETEATPRPERDVNSAPTAFVLGAGRLVDSFKGRFKHTPHLGEADLIIDLRINPGPKTMPEGARELPVLTFIWAHSASLSVPRYGSREVAGISLVPPVTDASVIELCAPVTGENRATELARRYFEAHGFPVLAFADQPGGIGFRVVAMLANEAIGALAESLATQADIDKAMQLGTNYPLGPLAWSERLGLANVLAGLEGLERELGEERYRPHPLLKRAVAAGLPGWGAL